MSQSIDRPNLRAQIIPPLTILRPLDGTATPPWQRNLIFVTFGGLLVFNQVALHRIPGVAIWTNAGLLLLLAVCCLKLPTARSALAGMLVIATANCMAAMGPNQQMGQVVYLASLAGLGLCYLPFRQMRYQPVQFTVWTQILVISLIAGLSGYLILNSYGTLRIQWLLLLSPLSALATEVVLRGLVQAGGQMYAHPGLAALVSLGLGIALASGQYPVSVIGPALLLQIGAIWLYWRYYQLYLTVIYNLITQLVCFGLIIIK